MRPQRLASTASTAATPKSISLPMRLPVPCRLQQKSHRMLHPMRQLVHNERQDEACCRDNVADGLQTAESAVRLSKKQAQIGRMLDVAAACRLCTCRRTMCSRWADLPLRKAELSVQGCGVYLHGAVGVEPAAPELAVARGEDANWDDHAKRQHHEDAVHLHKRSRRRI